MADDTKVGTIAFEVVARTSGVQQGLAQADKSVSTFANNATTNFGKYQNALTRMELSNRDAKQAIGTVSRALGDQGGVVAEVVKNVMEMGPAIGLAVGAFALYNEATKRSTANAAMLAKNSKDLAKLFRDIAVASGEIQLPGIFSKDAASRVDALLDKLGELREQLKKETTSSGPTDYLSKLFSWEKLDPALEIKKQIRMIKRAADQEVQKELAARPADLAKEAFDARQHEIKINTAPNSLERMRADMANTDMLLNAVNKQMEGMNKFGTDYNNILKEQRDLELSISGIADDIAAKQKEMAEDRKKALKDWAKDVKEMLQGAKTKPADSRWLFDRPWDKLKRMDKEKPEMAKLGFGLQLGNVSVEALQSAAQEVQKVSDPAQLKVLQQMNEKLSKPGTVVAVMS